MSKDKTKTKKGSKGKSSKGGSVKKPAKAVAKKRTRKELSVTPVTEKFTKSGLYQFLETLSGVEKRHVRKVLNAYEAVIMGSVTKKGRGEFMHPGMFKVVVKDIPAKKGGEKKKNPFTGEMMVTKSKPATRRVKLRPMKKVKDAALLGMK